MLPTKPVGEKPPDPNGRGGNTGAQFASPAPNQDVRGKWDFGTLGFWESGILEVGFGESGFLGKWVFRKV